MSFLFCKNYHDYYQFCEKAIYLNVMEEEGKLLEKCIKEEADNLTLQNIRLRLEKILGYSLPDNYVPLLLKRHGWRKSSDFNIKERNIIFSSF